MLRKTSKRHSPSSARQINHRKRFSFESLENRVLMATDISISDASAVEGNDSAEFVDVPISAASSPVRVPKSIAEGPDGDYFVVSNGTNSVLRYDGSTFQYEGEFVSTGSGGLSNPIDLAFAGGSLFVSSANNNSVLRYDGQTGQFLGAFVQSGAQGINRPTNLLEHEGSLYIGAWSGDVHRYDLATGQFIEKFVETGVGDLNDPVGLAFGPDGNFYVAEFAPGGNNAVLRFNGSTGDFMGEFIPAGTGGMIRPAGINFGPDGKLYVANTDGDNVLRYDASTGAFLDSLVAPSLYGIDGPTRLLFSGNEVFVASQGNNNVVQFELPTCAAFEVTLSAASDTVVTVDYQTADVTAVASADYGPKSGALTFAPGQTSQTIFIQTVDNSVMELNETFSVVLSNPDGAVLADGTGVASILDDDAKFYVVNDATADNTFRYNGGGSSGASSSLATSNTAPRGAASTAAGDKVWVVDANKKVYVYNAGGGLLGSWTAGGLYAAAQVEGVATDGTDIWLVDAKQDKVYRYAGAASRLSGSQNAVSSFSLNSANKNPKDIVTDGTNIWVVNDSTTDKVFKYTIGGSLIGSWTITAGGGSPTGITLDPSSAAADMWIVDNTTDKVYLLSGARNAGNNSSVPATQLFALAANNTNPQGIADPPGVNSQGGSHTALDESFTSLHSCAERNSATIAARALRIDGHADLRMALDFVFGSEEEFGSRRLRKANRN